MRKGTLAGGILGAVVSVVGLAVASVVGPQPPGAEPPEPPATTPPEDVAALPDAPDEPGEPPIQPAMPQIGAPATAPARSVPETSDAAVPAADTAPGGVPRTAAVTERPAMPEPAATPVLPSGAEAPVLPNPQAVAPSQPAGDADVVVSTDPGTPAAAPPSEAVIEEAEAARAAEPAEIAAADEDGALPGETADADSKPQAEAAEVAPEAATEGTAAAPDPGPTEPEDDARVVERGDGNGLPGGGQEVVVNRAVPQPDAPAPDAPAPEVAEPADPVAPPLERFGADFENPEGLPLLAVVLIDDGSLQDAPTAVASIGIPLTVAIDPSRPDAGEAMAAYRERGIEVAVLPRLPEGAGASDVEVTLEAALSEVPQAVALVDATGAWQSGGGVAEQALARLGAEGRGFVTISSGLNAGLRAAAAEEVPAAVVYRDLDADGQDARVIRRFVDQAAFRARQESGVVLLGRVRADTISALTLWRSANRAGQVALAPLSAVLRAADA